MPLPRCSEIWSKSQLIRPLSGSAPNCRAWFSTKLCLCLDREGPEYAKVNRDYQALRAHYFKALAAHPVGRALAALGGRLDRR